MTDTPHLGLPLIEASQAQKHVTHNEAIVALDAIVQLSVKDSTHAAPPAAVEGDRYKVASGATGDWAAWDLNIALYTQGVWQKLVPQFGWICFDEATGAITVWQGAPNYWVDLAAAGGYVSGNGETAVASAATCDIGAAPTSRVQVTGTTTITSFGTGANKIRILRFAQAVMLTHNAVSLILPGGANITTTAGDTCIAVSDASGNWCIFAYQRAAGPYVDQSGNLGVGTTSPAVPLHVKKGMSGAVPYGNAALIAENSTTCAFGFMTPDAAASGFFFGNVTSNTAGGIWYNAETANGLAFRVSANLTKMVIDSSGKVGIGSTVPNDTLDVNGNIVPHTDNARTCGTASFRWSTIYAATSTINTSMEAEKKLLGEPDPAVFDAVLSVPLRLFQWLEAIEKKGEAAARLHFGPTADDVAAAFIAHGLDPRRYALFCEDEIVSPFPVKKIVRRPKVEIVEFEVDRTETREDRVIVRRVKVQQERHVTRLVPVLREDGSAVTQAAPVLDGDGKPELDEAGAPKMVDVPVTQEIAVMEDVEVEEPALRPTGEKRLGLRLDQFILLRLEAMRRRAEGQAQAR
jgi:hypothetical protein